MLGENSVSLDEVTDWYVPSASHRVELGLSNQTGGTLYQYAIPLDLSTLPQEFFDIARVDGADLSLYLEDGTELTNRWLEYYNFISREGTLWLRLDTLPPGSTRLHIYFGDDSRDSLGAPEEIFVYSAPVEGSYLFSLTQGQSTWPPLSQTWRCRLVPAR